jgi:hypothetical protein
MAWSSQFSIIPMPQPWQALVGIWLGRRYFAASLFIDLISLPGAP